jgi:hypothetical protein
MTRRRVLLHDVISRGDWMNGLSVRKAAALARDAWDDRVARPCLVIGVVSVWLTVTLVDMSFLALLCASGWLLRWRHLNRPPVDLEDFD